MILISPESDKIIRAMFKKEIVSDEAWEDFCFNANQSLKAMRNIKRFLKSINKRKNNHGR
jgi:hypothetical protein